MSLLKLHVEEQGLVTAWIFPSSDYATSLWFRHLMLMVQLAALVPVALLQQRWLPELETFTCSHESGCLSPKLPDSFAQCYLYPFPKPFFYTLYAFIAAQIFFHLGQFKLLLAYKNEARRLFAELHDHLSAYPSLTFGRVVEDVVFLCGDTGNACMNGLMRQAVRYLTCNSSEWPFVVSCLEVVESLGFNSQFYEFLKKGARADGRLAAVESEQHHSAAKAIDMYLSRQRFGQTLSARDTVKLLLKKLNSADRPSLLQLQPVLRLEYWMFFVGHIRDFSNQPNLEPLRQQFLTQYGAPLSDVMTEMVGDTIEIGESAAVRRLAGQALVQVVCAHALVGATMLPEPNSPRRYEVQL